MRIFYFILIALAFIACNTSLKKSDPQTIAQSKILIDQMIKKGDSIYSLKSDYGNFSKSLELYDSAWQIAVKTKDNSLIANTIFAKGRAYDALNSNPQKTIDHYTEAAKLFATQTNNEIKALYIKHLVAHSYDKVKDSANCSKILNELYNDILPKPDTSKKKMQFIAEMALISTEVKNYELANKILQNLTQRNWIKNDSTEYDYLHHYYLTQARINVYNLKNVNSPYIDSLEIVFAKSKNLSDSMYYSSELYSLLKASGSKKANKYLELNNKVFNKFNTPENVRATEVKLAKLEVAAIETERKLEREKSALKTKSMYVLTILLSTITILALFLNKRNKTIRKKQNEVENFNKQLQQKNLQNEVLNKEIHHRVKNNLQMIMSLVNMQEYTTDKDEVKESMQAISLRIESIAKLHEQLMEQSDKVDLKNYVNQLVSNLSVVIGDGKQIMTHLHIEPIVVSQKISFPLGLIINEWITNSIKYAQPKQEILALNLKIETVDENIELVYEDNGVPQLNTKLNKSLGLSIVNLLVQQLEGKLDKKTENNFKYKLTIPNKNG